MPKRCFDLEKIRISKFLSDRGVMSRRAADNEIEKGNVAVNGRPAVLGQKIDPYSDVVTVNGKKVGRGEEKICLALNKPRGYVTTMSDERGRKCVSELVEELGARVYPIGRLDRDSEGLLLMTNDGELANMLTHPKYHKPKTYNVTVEGKVSAEQLERLGKPFRLDGYITKSAEVKRFTGDETSTVLTIKLFEGRNRQIRRMCDVVGLKVICLKRISIGDIHLGKLPVGKWRMLTAEQIESLKKGDNNA